MHRLLAAALTAGALVWTSALFLAPVAVTRSGPALSAAASLVYRAGALVCHQRPERSFHLAGVQFPVCARCLGLYVSGAVAAAVAWVTSRGRVQAPRQTRMALAVSAIPTAVTLALELAGFAHPSNAVRAFSALPLGAAAGWMFVRLLASERDTGEAPAR